MKKSQGTIITDIKRQSNKATKNENKKINYYFLKANSVKVEINLSL